MKRSEAEALTNVICRVVDYYVMAQRTWVNPAPSSDESIANAMKAEKAVVEALERFDGIAEGG